MRQKKIYHCRGQVKGTKSVNSSNQFCQQKIKRIMVSVAKRGNNIPINFSSYLKEVTASTFNLFTVSPIIRGFFCLSCLVVTEVQYYVLVNNCTSSSSSSVKSPSSGTTVTLFMPTLHFCFESFSYPLLHLFKPFHLCDFICSTVKIITNRITTDMQPRTASIVTVVKGVGRCIDVPSCTVLRSTGSA